MSRGVNKFTLIGRLGAEPQYSVMPNGKGVCVLSVATSSGWKDKNTGELIEKTEWHRVVLYERQAEIARDYAVKGREVYIEGPLRTRKWTDQQSIERYTTEVIGRDIQLLGGKPTEPHAATAGGENKYSAASSNGNTPTAIREEDPDLPSYGSLNPMIGDTYFDDDIPF